MNIGQQRLDKLSPHRIGRSPLGRWIDAALEHDQIDNMPRDTDGILAFNLIVDHAARWGTWTGAHTAAVDAAVGAAVNTISYERRPAPAKLTGTAMVHVSAMLSAGMLTASGGPRFDHLLDPTPADIDATRSSLLGYLYDVNAGGTLRGSLNWDGPVLRAADNPYDAVARTFADSNPAHHLARVRLCSVIADHPLAGTLLAAVPVPLLAETLERYDINPGAFCQVLAELDQSVFDIICGLWSTWTGTWGELAGVAEHVAVSRTTSLMSTELQDGPTAAPSHR